MLTIASLWRTPTVNGDDWQPISPEELKMTGVAEAPGAPAVYLYRQVDRDDNTSREYNYVRIKILSGEGRKYADIDIPFVKGNESIQSLKARTIRPDGSIVNFPLTTEVRQDIYGAFAYWSQEPWRVVATVYDVHIGLQSPASTRNERFFTGYVEADRELPHSLVAFGRVEDTPHARRSGYLTGNHPDFEVRRLILGLRWDFRPRQALTVEVGRGETSRGHQNEIRLQWSAALP